MSQDILANNKRIAKNTLVLYVRTFFTLLIGLYTGRVMLQVLGIGNYGINSVVGGIVSMSTIIVGTMSAAISRYLTCTLGKGDLQQMKMMFSTSINAQIVMALIVAIVLEVGGVWFLNSGANIPVDRMVAANWVLQCSIITLMTSLISSPYNALIVAHERMAVFAYTGIVETILKLGICFLLVAFDGDRLILFACLQVLVAIMMRIYYGWYCKKNFEEVQYSAFVLNKSLLKELTIFSGWSFLNNSAYIFSTQGANMLVNVFFGVTFNASRAVATTVSSAAISFVGNFTTAFSPQITKSYAGGDVNYSIMLVNRGTKFTWLLMYLFIVPICMESGNLLKLWLGEVPPMAALFLQLSMFESLAVSSGTNLLKLIQADGRIRRYTIESALYVGLVFPLSWLAFKLGAPVWTGYIIFIIVFFTINVIRYANLKRLMPFSIREHVKVCLLPCILVSITSFVVPIIVSLYLEDGLLKFFIVCIVSVIWTGLCVFAIGLTKGERQFFKEKAMLIVKKITGK